MSLEPANEYMGPDELVEATPNSLRLHKRIYAATHGKWVEPASAVPSLEVVLKFRSPRMLFPAGTAPLVTTAKIRSEKK